MGNSGSQPHEAALNETIDGHVYRVVFEPNPFDKGACRLAFKGTYQGKGPKNGSPCVTKVFIEEAARHYKNYKPDLKASLKANEFAESFNSEYLSTKPLRFMVPRMATVKKIGQPNPYVKPEDQILVEDFIEGKYEKFNDNDGGQTEEVAAIPSFSHYTYWKSNGAFLVCDIQGVRSPDGYTLTDPAVHSRTQGTYGPTDMGPSGMTRFFASHKCTSVCSQFPPPVFNGDRKINRGRADRRASSYTFMLREDELAANNHFKHRNDLPAIME